MGNHNAELSIWGNVCCVSGASEGRSGSKAVIVESDINARAPSVRYWCDEDGMPPTRQARWLLVI